MKLPANNKHVFSEVPKVEIPRSSFDRSCTHKTMFSTNQVSGGGSPIVPVFLDEVLPGDTWSVKGTFFMRLASALSLPLMDNLYLDSFWFYSPSRILWSNFKKFCGEQDSPNDSTSYEYPQLAAPVSTGWAVETIADYFGLPINVTGLSVNSLPFRMYNKTWNQWFRDQNLQTPAVERMGDTGDVNGDYILRPRNKRHDYFTSSLLWPQKGPSVTLPLGDKAPVRGIGIVHSDPSFGDSNVHVNESQPYGDDTIYAHSLATDTANKIYLQGTAASNAYPLIYADLYDATAASINDLRLAFQVQRMYERDARSGTRYNETVLAHFGVTVPDFRTQRVEFLGGQSVPIVISTVPQTSAAASQPTPQGNLAAYALGTSLHDGFTKSFTEHGYIMCLVNVRADMSYQYGIPRMFSRTTKFDMYWPALSHIGEQAVLGKEIYADGSSGDDTVWGYQERWAEYRYGRNTISGKLRSSYSTPLDAWHLGQKYLSRPTLGDDFIREAPPLSRVVAVISEPEIVLDSFFKIKAVRPMPTYSVPGLIDHF